MTDACGTGRGSPADEYRRDGGAAGVIAIAVIVALIAVFMAVGGVAGALVARRSAQAAADAAALAGADTAIGAATGLPCGRAAAVAVANGAQLVQCVQRGPVVRVQVSVTAFGLPAAGRAAAGPPPTTPSGPPLDGESLPRGGGERTVYGVR